MVMEPGISGSREDEAIQALGREVGRRSVERLGTGLTRIVEETSALYRWTLTMLVLLNGAALYLCVSARESIGPELFQQLVLVFFAGMMAALLAALLGMLLTLPVAGAMRRALAHWTDVSVSGALSDGAMASARQVKRSSAVWLTAMSLIVLVSLGLFGAGALLLGERFGMVGAHQQEGAAFEVSLPPSSEAVPGNAAQPIPEVAAPVVEEISAAPVIAPATVIAQTGVVAPVAPVATPARPAQIIPRSSAISAQQTATSKAPTLKVAPKATPQTATRSSATAQARVATKPAAPAARQTSPATQTVTRPAPTTTVRATPPATTIPAAAAPAPPQPEFVPLPVLKPSIAQ